MGYYTDYDLQARPISAEQYESIDAALLLMNDRFERCGYENNVGSWCDNDDRWYGHDEDMIEFSKQFPDVMFVLYGHGENRGDEWRRYYQNGKTMLTPSYITYRPFIPECMTAPDETNAVDEGSEVELNSEQIARNDDIDNAVYQCLLILLNKTEDEWPWDMNYIGEATDLLEEFLIRRGHKIWHPAVVTEEDGRQYVEDYVSGVL